MWSYVRWLILPDLGSERCASSRWGFSESTSGATRERQVVRAAKRRSNLAAYTAIAAMAAALGSSGCTELEPEDDTCQSVEGCVPPPEPLPPNWACIEQEPIEKEAPPDIIALVVFIVDLAAPIVVPPNFTVTTCAINDVTCGVPIADMTTGIGVAGPPLMPVLEGIRAADPTGTLERAARQILLPQSPNGGGLYLRIGAPGYAEVDYVLLDELQLNLEPVMMLPNPNPAGPPLRVAAVFVDPIGIPRTANLEEFYTGVGETRDPRKATTVARALDCDGRRAANVGLDVDVDGLAWAFKNGIPIPDVDSVTDVQGIIGYANLDPMNHNLSALVPNQTRSYREWAVPARPGGIVTLEMRPLNARDRQLNLNLLSQQQQQE